MTKFTNTFHITVINYYLYDLLLISAAHVASINSVRLCSASYCLQVLLAYNIIALKFHFHLAVLEAATLSLFHLYVLELKLILISYKDKWWIIILLKVVLWYKFISHICGYILD